MKRFILFAAFSIAVLSIKAQSTCDTIVSDFSHTNSGVQYYFFDESILNNPDSVSWSWNFDDGPNAFSALRNPSHYFYYAGDHEVCLTIDVFVTGVWCNKIQCDTITTVGVPAGIEEAKELELSLYPNPTTGTFTIQGTLPVERYTIYDALGRMLLQGKYTGPVIMLPATVAAGFYYLHMETAEGVVVRG